MKERYNYKIEQQIIKTWEKESNPRHSTKQDSTDQNTQGKREDD